MFGFIDGNLQSADEALAGVVVGVVMERLEGGKLSYELIVGFLFKFRTKFRIWRYFREGIAACRCFDV